MADADLAAQLPVVDPMAHTLRQSVGVPIRLNGEYGTTYRPAPAKGQHTREILTELGCSAQEIQPLLNDGSVFALDTGSV